jgi:outer membrane protein, heavy metal efflux system
MKFARALLFLSSLPAAALDWTDPQSLVAQAIGESPSIRRLEHEAAAARERIAPAAALPNPMLMAGIENKELDLSDDPMMTMYMVGAQQTFTSASKRKARQTAAELEVRAIEQDLARERAAIERDVLLGWYDVAAADSMTTTAMEVRTVIDAIVEAARVRYEVGNTIQAEVIRAQLERTNIDHMILTLRGERDAAIARLLPLLDLPADTVVPQLHLPHSTERRSIAGSLEASSSHPALLAQQADIDRAEEMIRLARLAGRPDIGLEASYGHRREQSDMFSVVASVELPIRRDSLIEPRIREAIAMREAARQRLEETRRIIERELAVAAVAHRQATEQLRLHEEVLVPQARLAFESTLASYQTGAASFDSVLAAETTYARLQLEYYEFLAQHIKAIVAFEAIRKGAL